MNDDQEPGRIINGIAITPYEQPQVASSSDNSFVPERGPGAEKARLKYFETHAQHDPRINPYLVEEHPYLLSEREQADLKAIKDEIAAEHKAKLHEITDQCILA